MESEEQVKHEIGTLVQIVKKKKEIKIAMCVKKEMKITV